MVFDRPQRQLPNHQATQRHPSAKSQHKNPTNSGSHNKGGDNNPPPSPWLGHPYDQQPNPHPTASFVEYLRWMRSPDSPYEDGTKIEILTKAETGNYSQRLKVLTERTRQLAGNENCIEVTCSWRIRVGGHRGPESILLPAFDALGMPYIPSSTLRGVARAQALRELQSEAEVAKYFGSLEAEPGDRAGKIIFFDAYPLPQQKNGGLAADMANNLWKWENGNLQYSANPNAFFSLRQVTFLIAIKPTAHCSAETLHQVRHWLIQGLTQGIGSQVNAGYGALVEPKKQIERGFFRVNFTLQGQLIHGHQRFTQWTWNDQRLQWQMRGQPQAEVRSTAFKSMLRYWFRALGCGILPTAEVQRLEGLIFGAIQPQPQQGYLRVRVLNGQVTQPEARPNHQGRNAPCGEQQGTLVLDYSLEVPDSQKENLAQLAKTLTWLMFHLGGIGQGARRPCYSRRNRERAPWWRGSSLIPKEESPFWELPDTARKFQTLFKRQLHNFYRAFSQLTQQPLFPAEKLRGGAPTRERWQEAVDRHCKIIVCSGEEEFDKPFALAVLHSPEFKIRNRRDQLDYDGRLCGSVQPQVQPSPVWIADLGEYQVVTVFGATQPPRNQYLDELKRRAREYYQLWPL
ncbi:RAMP superfamily CRISPR-associated protein [Thermosynechococcaceae cyanobacterium Okahandja]